MEHSITTVRVRVRERAGWGNHITPMPKFQAYFILQIHTGKAYQSVSGSGLLLLDRRVLNLTHQAFNFSLINTVLCNLYSLFKA